jgi:integrase
MAQRYQNGHLRIAKRKRGPDVWEFLWREKGPDGVRRQRTLTVGNVQKLPTHREAMNQLHTLRMNINNDAPISPVLTFQALADHYCRTELLAENKTPKTRKTYLVYLKRWILPKWGTQYLHLIKPIAVEQWIRSIEDLSDGSKAKIRNLMSALFSHAIRYEIADRNPITAVRQSAKRRKVPVILDATELHRLFQELGLRERAMIMTVALTGIRRSELMGLKWKDVDFIGGQIQITRSVVDQALGKCKTEESQKPVVIDEHIVHALIAWRQESTYTRPDDWVWASPHKKGKQPFWLSTIMRYYIQPALERAGVKKKVGWHTFRHTFSTLVKSLGVDAKVVQELVRHASFNTTMDRYTQALEGPKRQAQEQLADLIMRTGRVAHA